MLFTIGYEGRTVEEFIEVLVDASVERVVDVRELPSSRRKGFSKRQLTSALAERGIEYVHLRAAGNPFRALKDDLDACLARYAAHLDQHPEVVTAVEAAVEGRNAALLCLEKNVLQCHRGVLVGRLSEKLRRSVRHL